MSQRQQTTRIIEPLPGPSIVDWNKSDSKLKAKNEMQKSSKTSQAYNKSLISNQSASSKIESSKIECAANKLDLQWPEEPRQKSSLDDKEQQDQSSENVVMDRYGKPMIVRPETIKVLKQLPDLSFLSARTLLYNPEHKQFVPDLGAMINKKMPG